ncbi:spider venom protein Nep-5 [Trichonephila clavata]|uniref:Spider venom protein Nep-5 n=1 Tax=Trichonephila clavata TaxID=2740835 RepID=A0A8X6LRI7_TRICU|nr:spider venom protein Nep-5 [Trichonephila clavata]
MMKKIQPLLIVADSMIIFRVTVRPSSSDNFQFIFTSHLASLFIKIIMKAYFCLMVVVCVVLLSLQAVEMSPNARARRQSDNDNIVTLEIPQNILIRLLQGLLGALGLGGLLGGVLGR